jgi:hypothetical protein
LTSLEIQRTGVMQPSHQLTTMFRAFLKTKLILIM